MRQRPPRVTQSEGTDDMRVADHHLPLTFSELMAIRKKHGGCGEGFRNRSSARPNIFSTEGQEHDQGRVPGPIAHLSAPNSWMPLKRPG